MEILNFKIPNKFKLGGCKWFVEILDENSTEHFKICVSSNVIKIFKSVNGSSVNDDVINNLLFESFISIINWNYSLDLPIHLRKCVSNGFAQIFYNKSLLINGVDVITNIKDNMDCFGECNFDNLSIDISDKVRGIESSPDNKINTMFHELIHVILYMGGYSEESRDENIICTLASGLTQIFN